VASHPARPAASTAAPSVDFSREMIIAVGCGPQTDGHTVEIDSVTLAGGELLARYRRGWDPDQGLTDGFSDHVGVVRVPRADTPDVVFIEATSQHAIGRSARDPQKHCSMRRRTAPRVSS
jgi:hypothetical protein